MKKIRWTPLMFALLAPITPAIAETIASSPADGDLNLPAEYRSWPVFLRDIQRHDLKQIRDIYINPQGLKSSAPFPYGTTMVMELHTVKLDASGHPVLDEYGKMQKTGLSKRFVMSKGRGWGQNVPPELRTGEWVYASFDANGKSQGKDMNACRACHVPLKNSDFVARVAEFEQSRVR